ncbi:diguanylate cyclase domain-containing protein [Thalassobacillus hwangdonensis]|uniref:Diguanylate cyclase domain-containing protein n=1 Tax=Thalassobacillus hwangdonensis TaxID=546108 RepID=A0ABW3KVT0_9BACI
MLTETTGLHEQSLQALKLMGETLSDCVFLMKVEEGRFIYDYINESGFELARLSVKDLGKSLDETIPSNAAAFLNEKYQQVIREQKKLSYKDDVIFPTVQYKAETTLIPIFNDLHTITYIIGVTKNLTTISADSPKVKNTQRILSSFIENTEEAFVFLDMEQRIVRVNEAFYQMMGLKRIDTYETRLADLQPRLEEEFEGLYARIKAGEQLQRFETTFYDSHNRRIETSIHLTAISNESGEWIGVVMIIDDITEKMQTKRQLLISEERYRLIAEHSQDLISMMDSNGLLRYVSPSHKFLLGFSEEKVEGNDFFTTIVEEDREEVRAVINSLDLEHNKERLEFRMYRQDKEPIWVESHFIYVESDEQLSGRIISSARDITQRKEAETKLKKLAYTDYLTSLSNRRVMERRLSEWKEAIDKEQNSKFALLYLDGDRFKDVNDTYGHRVGDALLQMVAKRIVSSIRDKDFVARLGGDEFAILVPQLQCNGQAEDIADRILNKMNQPFHIDGVEVNFSFSIGISIYPDDGNDIETVQIKADDALYAAKKLGKNRYVFNSWLKK